jgi:hypothetical protein
MVRLGMRPGSLHTAMDVEEGLDLLERSTLRSGTA